MTYLELTAFLNFILALLGMSFYLRNAIRCKSIWKTLKFAFALNIGIVAILYGLIIMDVIFDPLIVRLNTTLLLILLLISALLGRSKYGNRS